MDSTGRSTAARLLVIAGVIALVAILLMMPWVQALIHELASPFEMQERVTFSLEHQFAIDANGGIILNYTVDCAQPMNESESGYNLQVVDKVSYSPNLSSEGIRYGQPWVVWEGGRLTEKATISATYMITVTSHVWNYDQASSGSIADIPHPLMQKYLQDEWKIEATAPAIISLQHSIVGNDTNVYSILSKIYTWMVENIHYPSSVSSGEPKSATETLASRLGKCDEQAILFCSLARAAGVPAWLQLGALYLSFENSWGGHGWVQAYIPNGKGGGENVTIDTVNRQFLVWTSNHVVVFTDDGVASHLIDYYYTFSSNFDESTYAPGEGPIFSDTYMSADNRPTIELSALSFAAAFSSSSCRTMARLFSA